LEYVSNGTQVRGIQVSLKQEQIPSYQGIMALYMAEIIEKGEEARLDSGGKPHGIQEEILLKDSMKL
jgi:hypothetical protein